MPISPVWRAVIALLALFLGGGGIGLRLAETLAPGSRTAQVVSFFALPLAFALSLQLWYGLALLSLVPRLLRSGRRRRGQQPGREPANARLPGSIVFLPVTAGIAAMAGIVVGLLSSTRSAWLVAVVYLLVGTAHGLVAWRLARGGILVPPDSL